MSSRTRPDRLSVGAATALPRRDPSARRRHVLDAAARSFAERGYEATSVNQVAAAAGVSVGALYKYFPDKAALLEGVLADFESAFLDAMMRPEIHQGPRLARLGPMMRALFDLAATREHFFWALTSGTHALRGPRANSPGGAMRAAIAAFIREGIAAGEFRAVDADRTAALGFGMVEAAMQRCLEAGGGPDERAAWTALLADVLARAVGP